MNETTPGVTEPGTEITTPVASSWPLNEIDEGLTSQGTLSNERRSIRVVYQASREAQKTEFDSESYAKEHKAGWEAAGKAKIEEFLNEYANHPDSGVMVSEKLEESFLFGNGARVDVYAHAVFDPSRWVTETDASADQIYETLYVVSAWLTREGKTTYVELYRYTPVPEGRGQSWQSTFPFELYFDNTGEAETDASLRNKVLTTLVDEFGTDDTKHRIVWFFDNKPDENGRLRMMFKKISEGPGTAGTTLISIGTVEKTDEMYSQDGAGWTLFGHKKTDFVKEFYNSGTAKNMAVEDFSENCVGDTYAVRKECGKGLALLGEVTRVQDTLKVSITLMNGENRLMVLDQRTTKAAERYTDADGNEMTILYGNSYMYDRIYYGLADIIKDQAGPTDATADWAIVKYFPKGETKASQEFDASAYLQENRKQLEENAKAYEKQLREQFDRIKGNQSVAVAEKKLADIELSGKVRFVVYENAAYGVVPPAVGSGDVFLYEVAYYIVENGSKEPGVKGILFSTCSANGKLTEKQHPMAMVQHYFTPDMKEMTTASKIGRETDSDVEVIKIDDEEPYEQYCYNSTEYWYEVFTDPSGKLMLDMYDTWGEATDYYISMGTKIRTADGKVVYLEDGKTWNVLDKKMLDWAAPYRQEGKETRTEVASVDLGGAKLSIRYYVYGKDTVYLDVYVVKDDVEIFVKDNRWLGIFQDED
ncbi:MAG: hypothetical protein J5645_01460 [Lachnospiraceae bacterium]|nr:hypothetical protein [Lachnospiraceae bacterium]